jgi:hypothetical protein
MPYGVAARISVWAPMSARPSGATTAADHSRGSQGPPDAVPPTRLRRRDNGVRGRPPHCRAPLPANGPPSVRPHHGLNPAGPMAVKSLSPPVDRRGNRHESFTSFADAGRGHVRVPASALGPSGAGTDLSNRPGCAAPPWPTGVRRTGGPGVRRPPGRSGGSYVWVLAALRARRHQPAADRGRPATAPPNRDASTSGCLSRAVPTRSRGLRDPGSGSPVAAP